MNKLKILFVLILYVLSDLGYSQCTSNSATIYSFSTNGVTYEIIKVKLNWVNASACAVARGGKLAEINSQTEQDSLFFYVNNAGIVVANTIAPDGGGASYLWLGGNDIATEGKWVWDGDNNGTTAQFWQGTLNGNSVGGLYNNWGNEPDNWNGQDALGFAFTNWPLGLAGQWNDVDELNQLYYIVEYNTPNTTITETKEYSFSVYPNPLTISTNLYIDITQQLENGKIQILNTLGQIVLEKKIDAVSNNATITIPDINLPAGIYYIAIQTKENITTEKLIITQ